MIQWSYIKSFILILAKFQLYDCLVWSQNLPYLQSVWVTNTASIKLSWQYQVTSTDIVNQPNSIRISCGFIDGADIIELTRRNFDTGLMTVTNNNVFGARVVPVFFNDSRTVGFQINNVQKSDPTKYRCFAISNQLDDVPAEFISPTTTIQFSDQCVTEGLCANFATCSVVNGLETCTCAPEYSGDGLSAPGSTGCRSKCDLACPMYSTCTLDSAYVASCQCNPNFVSSNGACVDVNECLTSGWCRGANTYCLNSIGGFSCECQPNYLVNAATSGRDRSCTTFQSCSIGKSCKCATVSNPTSVPLITFFFGVNSANPATALQYLDIWSDVNVKAYCKATGCDQSMLGDIISNITIYVRRAEEMMNNSMAAMQKVREYIDCNSFEALEPAWWNLYDTLSSQFLIFKQVKRDMDMKLTFMMEESKKCETTNTDWFRKYLEWLSPAKY